MLEKFSRRILFFFRKNWQWISLYLNFLIISSFKISVPLPQQILSPSFGCSILGDQDSFVCNLQKPNSNWLKQRKGMYCPPNGKVSGPVSRYLKDVIKNLFLFLGFAFLGVGFIHRQAFSSGHQDSRQSVQRPQQFQFSQEFQQKFYFHWSVLGNNPIVESITVTRGMECFNWSGWGHLTSLGAWRKVRLPCKWT